MVLHHSRRAVHVDEKRPLLTFGGSTDRWLMEDLAGYSALMYVEKRRGTRFLEVMLESYRVALLQKNGAGQTVDEAGLIVLGTRLENLARISRREGDHARKGVVEHTVTQGAA